MLKSYLGPMFVTFFIVMFILLMNFLWRYIDELVGKGLPINVLVELLFYATSTLMPMGLPLATLLAAIMTLGNLGENNELLALKAAGISLSRIMRPIVIVAILISIGSFFVMNNFVPFSYRKMSSLLFDIRQQRGEIEFKDGVFFNGIPNVSIRVDKQDGKTKKLTNILIYDTRDNNSTKTIVADSGYINLSKDKKFLRIRLYQGQNYEDNRNWEWYDKPILRHHVFDYEEMIMALEGFNFERSNVGVFNEESAAKNIVELNYDIDSLETITNNKTKIFLNSIIRNRILQGDSTEAILCINDSIAAIKHNKIDILNRFDTLDISKKSQIYDIVANRLNDIKYYVSSEHDNLRVTTTRMYKSQIDWHKKVALPVSVLIFFLIGAPLGAIIRKGGLGTPVVISVFFFIIYYVISLTGDKMVNDGVWSPLLGQWLSSIILFPLAIFLSYKSATDSQLFNKESYLMKIDKVKSIIKKISLKLNIIKQNKI